MQQMPRKLVKRNTKRYRASMVYPWLLSAPCIDLKGGIVRYTTADGFNVCEKKHSQSHGWFKEEHEAVWHLVIMLAGSSILAKSGKVAVPMLARFQLYDLKKITNEIIKHYNLN